MKPSPQRKGKGASRTPPPTPYIVIGTNVVGAVYATATVGDKRLPPATIAPVWSPEHANVWHKFRANINKKRVFIKRSGTEFLFCPRLNKKIDMTYYI